MGFPEFTSWLRARWPQPPSSTLDRLRHTLEVYDSKLLDRNQTPPDDKLVIQATGGWYPAPTGITWGDLRRIRAFLEVEVEDRYRDPFKHFLADPMKPIVEEDPR